VGTAQPADKHHKRKKDKHKLPGTHSATAGAGDAAHSAKSAKFQHRPNVKTTPTAAPSSASAPPPAKDDAELAFGSSADAGDFTFGNIGAPARAASASAAMSSGSGKPKKHKLKSLLDAAQRNQARMAALAAAGNTAPVIKASFEGALKRAEVSVFCLQT
jgi:hypothetical protein